MDSVTARALLGVHPSADADEIKRAFRRLARIAHPDHGGTDAQFRRLLDAQRVVLTQLGLSPMRHNTTWLMAREHRPTLSIVDAPRPRRARCTEAGSPRRSFGDILARTIAAA